MTFLYIFLLRSHVNRAIIFLAFCFATFPPKAISQDTAAQATSPEAELRVGNQYFEKQDYPNAISWYRKAADQGNAEAQAELGWLYKNGRGVKQDYAEAMAWYRKAATQANPNAEGSIGWFYQQGLGVTQDYAEAMSWYQKAAEHGNFAVQTNVGLLYQNGLGVKQNYSEALVWYQKAASKGDALARNNIGTLYESGLGVDRDPKLAMAWYYQAADQGSALAERNVGRLYEAGLGVQQDYGKAANWFRKAAEQGDADAQVRIGWLYQNGLGVHEDYAEAMTWYQKAAAQNDANAQNNIGWFYQNGFGVKLDYREAMTWYRKAAEQGNARAKGNMEWLSRSGLANNDTKPAAQSAVAAQPASGEKRPLLLPNGIRAAQAIFAPDPDYSEEARKAKLSGTVVLSLVISAEGVPEDIKVVGPLGDGLDEKAVETIKTWKFQPAMKYGKPVALPAVIEVQFHLYGAFYVGKVEVLGGPKAENLSEYLSPLVRETENCLGKIPDQKALKQAQLTLEISIEEDGRVHAPSVVVSSGDELLDGEVRGCISLTKMEKPLPAEVKDKNLVVRMQVLHNTSGVSLNPTNPQVTTGSSEQFYIDVAGTLSKEAYWSLTGAGCDGNICGTITPEGLYTAPNALPQPAIVRIVGTLTGANPIAASAIISLTQKGAAVPDASK
jgi:TonB family protein